MERVGIEVGKLVENELKQYDDEISHLAIDIGGNCLLLAVLLGRDCFSSFLD